MVFDEDLLIESVRVLNAQGRPAHCDTVSIELGTISGTGTDWDVVAVAKDLAELESLGELERAADFEWGDIGPPPITLIAYAVRGEQTPAGRRLRRSS